MKASRPNAPPSPPLRYIELNANSRASRGKARLLFGRQQMLPVSSERRGWQQRESESRPLSCYHSPTAAYMTIEQITRQAFDRLKALMADLEASVAQEVYAIPFWKDNLDDDPRQPVLRVGYNTLAQYQASIANASSPEEAKWNYAFWLQNEGLTIGGEDPEFTQWVRSTPGYYSDEEYEAAEDSEDEAAWAAMQPFDDKIQADFMEMIILLAQRMHAEGIIHSTFGRPIPIIIHELEYYDEPLSWTRRGNPAGLTAEFEQWVRFGS